MNFPVSNETDAFLRNTMSAGQKAGIRNRIGLGNVDNTADDAKPVSTAQAEAISDAVDAAVEAAADDLDNRALKKESNLSDLNNAEAARGNLQVVKNSFTMIGKSITSNVMESDEPPDYACQTVRLGSPWVGDIPNGYALPTLASMNGKRPVTYTNATGGAMSFYDPGNLLTPLFTIPDNHSVTVWRNKVGAWQWVVGAAIVQDGLIYDAGTASGNIQLHRTNGLYQKVQIGASNPTPVFLPPMNGNTNETLTVRVKAHATDASTLAFDPAILVPSDYAGELPKPLGLGLTYKIKLEYNGSAWELQALVGGYAA